MPSDPASNPGAAHARRELLGGLALALKLLTERVLPPADTAREAAELAARAEALAAEAWALGAARMPDAGQAAALQAAFRSFIEETAGWSDRAARAAAICREVGRVMERHAAEVTRLARCPEAGDPGTLRSRLRPIVASLEQLPARMAASHAMAEDVVAMGARAARLGDDAMAAQDRRIPVGQNALALYRGLRGIAEDSGAVAETLLAEARQLRGTISGIATQLTQISSAGTAPATAEARLSQVVAHGAGTAAPRDGGVLDWGLGRRS